VNVKIKIFDVERTVVPPPGVAVCVGLRRSIVADAEPVLIITAYFVTVAAECLLPLMPQPLR
jgi:hypothetical protein